MERILRTPKTNGVKIRIVSFTFYPSGNSATALTTAAGTLRDPGGMVTDVTQSADGNFVCTMKDPAYRVVSKQTSVATNATNVDLYSQFGAVANEGTADPLTVVVRTKTGATSTAPPAADANTNVSVTLVIEDSSASGVA